MVARFVLQHAQDRDMTRPDPPAQLAIGDLQFSLPLEGLLWTQWIHCYTLGGSGSLLPHKYTGINSRCQDLGTKKFDSDDAFRQFVGERIRSARGEGLTQKRLAEAIGKSEDTVRNYESHATSPDIVTLKKIADVTGKDLGYFIGYPTNSSGDHGRLVDPHRVPPEETTKTLAGYFEFGDRIIKASLVLEAYGPPSRLGGWYRPDEPGTDEDP